MPTLEMQSKRRYDPLSLRSLPPEQTPANYGQWEQTASSEGKESSLNTGDLGSVPGWEEFLEEEMATHSCILAWTIPPKPQVTKERILEFPWTEEPRGLQSMGS